MPEDQETMLQVEQLLKKATSLLASLETQVRLLSRGPQGTYPLFHDDDMIEVSLPFAAFETTQMLMATRRNLPDPVLLRMLVDLMPSLEGHSIVEVGAFSGALSLFLHKLLNASATHLIEPQRSLIEGLRTTIEAAGGVEAGLHMHDFVIGARGQAMAIAATRPEKLAESYYVRREGGPLTATALDDLVLGSVKLMILDYAGPKVDAINGALTTIQTCRPVVCVDQSGRDTTELREIFGRFEYNDTPVGKRHFCFVPA